MRRVRRDVEGRLLRPAPLPGRTVDRGSGGDQLGRRRGDAEGNAARLAHLVPADGERWIGGDRDRQRAHDGDVPSILVQRVRQLFLGAGVLVGDGAGPATEDVAVPTVGCRALDHEPGGGEAGDDHEERPHPHKHTSMGLGGLERHARSYVAVAAAVCTASSGAARPRSNARRERVLTQPLAQCITRLGQQRTLPGDLGEGADVVQQRVRGAEPASRHSRRRRTRRPRPAPPGRCPPAR